MVQIRDGEYLKINEVLGRGGSETLALYLSTNNTLRALDLSGTEPGVAGKLWNITMQRLAVVVITTNAPLSPHVGVIVLAAAIKCMGALTSLGLSSNRIEAEGAKHG
jgi:hypothetical protein